MAHGLRSIDEIPTVYRHIFSQFSNFNRMQSVVMNDVLYSDKSIVLSAPTGCGKTVILELAIIQLLNKFENAKCKEDYKIVYMAPIKALCNEITADWKNKFQPLGLSCVSVTGDDCDYEMGSSKSEIIITTPEKWDSLSRKWNGNMDFMKTIKLFMIDEVHLLNEDTRGPILETVVSRMKTIRTKLNEQENATKTIEKIRFIAVSATIPNIEDLATWLDTKENTVYHKIPDELRPVKLEKHVLGYSNSNQLAPFRFDMNLTYHLPSIIVKYSNQKPVLIFCNSRRSTEMAATAIVKKVLFNFSDEQRENFSKMSNQIKDNKLRTVIASGIAFHHAGLCVSDRKLIEDNFRSTSIPVLCSTNTLAMGVNLPAYLVIIKSTDIIFAGKAHELSEAVLLQMIGRAGRPQFDVHGIAVIMTQNNKVKQYENLITGTAPIESHLHKHLVEHLNSEILSQTISTVDLAVQWIRTSYLYIRAIQKPHQYGLPINAPRSFVENKMEALCVSAIDELVQNGLVTKENSSIKTTDLGRLMALHYLNFETMKHFKKIKGTETIEEMFEILISCPGYIDGYHLRVDDKRVLNELSSSSNENEHFRFPIKGKVKTVTDKISCLVQAVLGNIPIPNQSLTEEAAQMIKLGQRIARAMLGYIATLHPTNFTALTSMMLLSKAFQVNLWENSTYVFKQCKKIGAVYSKLLQSRGRTSFESVVNCKPSDIEMILRKHPPFGSEFLEIVSVLPRYTLEMELKDDNHIYIIAKQINPKFVFDSTTEGVSMVVGDSSNKTLFISHNVQYFLIKYGKFERTIRLKNSSALTIIGHLIHYGIVGLDKSAEVILRVDQSAMESSIIELSDDDEPKGKVSKRKSTTKAKGQTNQPKVSDYMKSRKRSSKTVVNIDVSEKKKKEDDDDVMNGSDEIEWYDDIKYTENSVALHESYKVPDVPTPTVDVDMTIERQFERPKGKAFTLIPTSKSLKTLLGISLYDDIFNSQDDVIQSKTIDKNQTKTVVSKKPKFTFLTSYKDQKLKDKIEIQSQKRGVIPLHAAQTKENEPIITDSEEKEESFASPMINLHNSPREENLIFNDKNDACIDLTIIEDHVPKKRNLNFSYEHLLTPLTPPKKTSIFELKSLQKAIDKQHKHQRIPITSSATAIPFSNRYVNNFSAKKELKRVNQLNCTEEKIIEIPMFASLQISLNNSLCVDTSLNDWLPTQRGLNGRQKLINEQIERKTHKINQLALSERQPSQFQQFQLSATNTTGVSSVSTRQLKNQISVNSNIRSGYEPTNSKLLNVDPSESFFSQADPSKQRWSNGISIIPNNRREYEPMNLNLNNYDPFSKLFSQVDHEPQMASIQQLNNGMSMTPNNRREYEPTNFNPLDSDPFPKLFSQVDHESQMASTQQSHNGMSMIPNNRIEYEPTNFNRLDSDPFPKFFSQIHHESQMASTQQLNNGMSMIPINRHEYEPTNFNLNYDPSPKLFSQADHYHNAKQKLFSSKRSQHINSNKINQNGYEQPSQINALIQNRTDDNMDTSHLMNYNYKPSYPYRNLY